MLIGYAAQTQLNTLLQDRTVEGRWAAVVLTKAAIEAGGLEVLSKSNPWVKHLLGILKRPDPPTTRSLVVLTLTRIFMLTWSYSNLIREITTPALTTFIPTCISNIENKRCSAAELQTVLEAFAILIPKHPTIFRQNENNIRSICTAALSSGSIPTQVRQYSQDHQKAARRLLVLLHHCAPKQGGSDKWVETLKSTVEAVHATCDHVFRAVHEDWQSVAGVKSSVSAQRVLSGTIEVESEDAVGLAPWKGVYAGAERVVSLLNLLKSHLTTATSATMTVRIGLVSDLLTRLFGVVVPYHGKQDFVKINNQVPKEEREALFAVLPRIHVASIELSRTLISRLSSTSVGGCQIAIDQVMYVFHAESSDAQVRSAIYELLSAIFEISGPSMGRTEVGEVSSVLRSCCLDLLPDAKDAVGPDAKTNGQVGGIKQQLGLAGGQILQSDNAGQNELLRAAQALLRTALLRIDALPSQLRALVDRTAALTRNHPLLQASVMNPPAKRSVAGSAPASLLPILAREYSRTVEVEVLLRPRLPVIGKKSSNQSGGFDDDEDEDEDEEDEDAGAGDDEGADQDEGGLRQDEEAVEAAKEDPTTDLLDTLGQKASLEPSISTTTTAKSLFASENAIGKRRATDEVADLSAKRLRASPEAARSPGLSTSTQPTGSLAEVVVSRQALAVPVVPASSAPTVGSYHTATAGDSEDDSDFEIPTIHVGDSDQDEEEDDEE